MYHISVYIVHIYLLIYSVIVFIVCLFYMKWHQTDRLKQWQKAIHIKPFGTQILMH